MKRVIICLALLLTATGLAPSASAETFEGSLSAEAVFLQGDAAARSESLTTYLGGEGAFDVAPTLELRARALTIDHDSSRYYAASQGETDLVRLEDERSGSRGTQEFQSARIDVASWQPSGSDLLVLAEPQRGRGTGATSGFLGHAMPLALAAEPLSLTVGPELGETFAFDEPYKVDIPRGSLALTDPDLAQQVSYEGTFRVFLYGATYMVIHDGPTAYYETGLHRDDPTDVPDARGYWLNMTVLTVQDGRLTLAKASDDLASYTERAQFTGTGVVTLRAASGYLRDEAATAYPLERQDLSLAGAFDLTLRGDARGGLVAGVAGEFERDLLLFATTTTGSAAAPWWLLLGLGLVAAGGVSGGAYLLRARTRTPQAASALAPATQVAVEERAEAPHLDPGFAWDLLSEEFGVVRAGERGGVLVVLVPSDRVEPFLHAVVARGLMAEDTGDRVRAGKHELAVVALEPSPVMMN